MMVKNIHLNLYAYFSSHFSRISFHPRASCGFTPSIYIIVALKSSQASTCHSHLIFLLSRLFHLYILIKFFSRVLKSPKYVFGDYPLILSMSFSIPPVRLSSPSIYIFYSPYSYFHDVGDTSRPTPN